MQPTVQEQFTDGLIDLARGKLAGIRQSSTLKIEKTPAEQVTSTRLSANRFTGKPVIHFHFKCLRRKSYSSILTV